MNLLDLFVKISIDDQASQKLPGISSNVVNSLGKAAKVGAAAMTATTAAVGAVSAAFTGAVGNVAEYGDNIDKMSQKMGMSAQAYQEWDAVMQHSGTSMETMKASMKTLANAAESGNEAFQRLGLTQEQIASMSQEQLFEATIAGLQGVSDTTERTYLAGQLLGRGATELGALLNTSAEDTQAMRDRVHELGGVMSDEAVKASAAYQDSIQDMNTAINGIKNRLIGGFLPAITTVTDGLQELFSGNEEEGLAKIGEGISNVVARVSEVMPDVIEMGGRLLGAIVQGVVQNFPMLITAVVDGVGKFADSITENSDTVVESAGELLMGIATAIVNALPHLIASLGGMLLSLIGSIATHIPDMLAAGVELFTSLITSIGDALGGIADVVGGKIQEAIDAVTGFAKDAFDAGAKIVNSIIEGIGSVIGGIADKIGEGLQAARDLLPFSPAKKGPFSGKGWTLYSGMSMMQGLAEGIEKASGSAQNAMQDALYGMQGATTATAATAPQGANDTLLGELRAIRADLANMRVYLDGNLLVGGISTRMDRALGAVM